MVTAELNPGLGPRTKIERAKEHLADLDREINSFTASNPYRFVIHDDPDGTRHIILDSHEPIPMRWSAIVGDIIHNARSALDVLATHAASIETHSIENRKFPIFRDKADFEKRAFKNWGQNCPRTIRFIKLLGPYERGYDLGHHSHTLALLNRLSVRDKHTLIIPVGTAAGYAVIAPKAGFGEPFKLRPPDEALLKDGEIVMTVSPRDPNFAGKDFEIKLTVQIRLSGVERLPAVGASSVLHHIVKIVDRIITIAERVLLLRQEGGSASGRGSASLSHKLAYIPN
jgi:hypothetical protein